MLNYVLDRIVHWWKELEDGTQFSLFLLGLGLTLSLGGGTLLEFIWDWELYAVVYIVNVLTIILGVILAILGIGTALENS